MLFMFIEMNQAANFVEIFLLVVVSALIFFDIYLYLNKTSGDTISNIMRDWVYDKFFFITYLWGVLAGHFFLGTDTPPFPKDNNLSVAIVLVLALAILFSGLFIKKRVSPGYQVVLFILGTIVGHFFWSLNS